MNRKKGGEQEIGKRMENMPKGDLFVIDVKLEFPGYLSQVIYLPSHLLFAVVR